MNRVKYKAITEGAGVGALESIKGIALADGRTVKVLLDPVAFEYAILNENGLIKSGSGRHLNAVKRLARKALVELGAPMTKEKRSSPKKVIAQAQAVVDQTTTGPAA